jgi:hypothetical protein
MTEQQVLSILQHHLPERAVHYCLELWREKPFTLKIAKSRLTKSEILPVSEMQRGRKSRSMLILTNTHS